MLVARKTENANVSLIPSKSLVSSTEKVSYLELTITYPPETLFTDAISF